MGVCTPQVRIPRLLINQCLLITFHSAGCIAGAQIHRLLFLPSSLCFRDFRILRYIGVDER